MQGIFVDGKRPKSKKAVREAIADDPTRVHVEATSMFGNEFDGIATQMDPGTVLFVGPDPYTSRNFYGKLTLKPNGDWSVV